MPSKSPLIRPEPGVFTHLPKERIDALEIAAKTAVKAWRLGENDIYLTLINNANKSLTKHERGIFNGFALSEVRNGHNF